MWRKSGIAVRNHARQAVHTDMLEAGVAGRGVYRIVDEGSNSVAVITSKSISLPGSSSPEALASFSRARSGVSAVRNESFAFVGWEQIDESPK